MGCIPSIHNIKNFEITLNGKLLSNDIINSSGYHSYFIKDIKKYNDWDIKITRTFNIKYKEHYIHFGIVISDKYTRNELEGELCYTYMYHNIPLLNKIYTDDNSYCIICFTNVKENVFIPCGHFNTCSDCNLQLVKRNCPTCRQSIMDIICI